VESSNMRTCEPDLIVDPALIRKYDQQGPRYTSYPTADRFVETYTPETHAAWLAARAVTADGITAPLSLYVHLPFCANICYYCACNKVITKDHGRSAKYLRYLAREMDLVSAHLQSPRRVTQLHWGGGTPTFLSDAELIQLMAIIREHFDLDPVGEYSLEIDPRNVSVSTFETLGQLGLNRVSLGVQDFDPAVQQAIHRVQTVEETRASVDLARANGMNSVNIDLIYGLPKQNKTSFARTLDQVVELDPDRISLYSYAHIPAVFKPQRRILDIDMPSPDTKLALLTQAIDHLREAGYVYIGMDHFAKPDDPLNIARQGGRLHRNFQGYSTQAECDLVALGISAISQIGAVYAQNVKTLDDYYDRLDAGQLPVQRGVELTADDLLRRAIIQQLMCHFKIDIPQVEKTNGVVFKHYFAPELAVLADFVNDGLVTQDQDAITVTPKGRLLVRAIAMVFDKYLQQREPTQRFSKII
jgi:oxygen-independent coproporphyrinogen III oxidase